ncbi:hypothetical protein VM98_37945, partial [Streptomyces rubellomurinus subsp. indigoferus]
ERLAEFEPAAERDGRRLAAAQQAVGVESALRLRQGAAEAHRRARTAERPRRHAVAGSLGAPGLLGAP